MEQILEQDDPNLAGIENLLLGRSMPEEQLTTAVKLNTDLYRVLNDGILGPVMNQYLADRMLRPHPNLRAIRFIQEVVSQEHRVFD